MSTASLPSLIGLHIGGKTPRQAAAAHTRAQTRPHPYTREGHQAAAKESKQKQHAARTHAFYFPPDVPRTAYTATVDATVFSWLETLWTEIWLPLVRAKADPRLSANDYDAHVRALHDCTFDCTRELLYAKLQEHHGLYAPVDDILGDLVLAAFLLAWKSIAGADDDPFPDFMLREVKKSMEFNAVRVLAFEHDLFTSNAFVPCANTLRRCGHLPRTTDLPAPDRNRVEELRSLLLP
jgi:hypothetical protein